ncbi:N-lysine methyltransferase setd6 [Pistacia vera]|uniref:N-lysine methyltransferase setd6 n=1 Tax=Pistacia vera TaxID=55513 RepID=UPI0012633D96|nr:N-lysine methyltransferase setd6 [Pistacia vera]
MASRRVRAFKRWMSSHGIEYSDALHFKDDPERGISVVALCDLKEGDVVATIPKTACLTVKTSGACKMIEAAGLGGILGLSVALMYERSLGEESSWAGYLQLLPHQECVPFAWSLAEVDSLLCGTELHKVLFNHKTGAEDVHFSSVSSHHESVNDDDDDNHEYANASGDDDEPSTENSDQDRDETDPSMGNNSSDSSDAEPSSVSGDDSSVLQMIMVKDVKVGIEIFNTYGLVGNAALLHRYGFTEPENSYDIVNIDLELVLQWSSSLFSSRYTRARLSLWRRLGYSGCVSQSSEYFEIAFNGEPQIELLILLYFILLPEDTYHTLDLSLSAGESYNEAICTILSKKNNIALENTSDMSTELFFTESVCNALSSLADMRESCYAIKSKEDDIEVLRSGSTKDRKLYHSSVLRLSERRILENLRNYAAALMQSLRPAKRSSMRKRLKRNGMQH